MARRSAANSPGYLLRTIATYLGKISEDNLQEKIDNLEPKDQVEFIYKFLKLSLEHPDMLKTDSQRKKAGKVSIKFLGKDFSAN